MTTRVDAKWAAIAAYPGAMSDKTLAWLQANGATSGALADAWLEMLTAKGFGPGAAPPPQNVIQANGNNFILGTSVGATSITPDNIGGLAIYYFGSFGENFWNLRMGDGTQQIPGVTSVTVRLGGSPVGVINWNEAQNRYQDSASGSLWNSIGEVGEQVSWSISGDGFSVSGSPATTIGPFHLNDNWHALLGSLGYTGSISDRELQFWEAGGVIP